MRTLRVLLVCLFLFVSAASAAVLVDQPYDGTTTGCIAQFYFGYGFGCYQFDDFTISQDSFLTFLTAYGIEYDENPSLNVDVVGEIWSDLPGSGSIILSSVSGYESESDARLIIDFGGQALPAGSYWLTAYIVRTVTERPWFWYGTTPINGSYEYCYDPTNFLGCGTLVPGEVVSGYYFDMAFTLEGEPVPEPSMIGLFGLGLAAVILRRRGKK